MVEGWGGGGIGYRVGGGELGGVGVRRDRGDCYVSACWGLASISSKGYLP